MEHLIESVRKNLCLWKVDTEDYKNNEIREAAWRNVIVESDITDVKETKCMWKKLRDGHRQALNKRKTTTGQAASSDNRLWKYEKQMNFLLPHLTNRQRSTKATATNDTVINDTVTNATAIEDTAEIVENIKENTDLSTVNKESQQATYTTQRKKRKIDKLTEYLEQEQKRREQRSNERDLFRKELLGRENRVQPKEDTALKKFFDSVCDETNKLPYYLQLKVQRQIFNSVMEAREETLRNQLDCPNSGFLTDSQHRTHLSRPCSSHPHASPMSHSELHSPSTHPPTLSRPSSSNTQWSQYNVASPGPYENQNEDLRSYLLTQHTPICSFYFLYVK